MDPLTSRTDVQQVLSDNQFTKAVESFTQQVPAQTYFTAAVSSVAVSALLAAFTQRKSLANFVGLWAPTLLMMSIYKKLVEIESKGGDSSQIHH